MYIAPQIRGTILSGSPKVYDELTSRDLDPNSVDDKIIIYERQVKGWFLDVADRLKNEEDSGFVVLNIGVSCLEGIQKNIEGITKKKREKKINGSKKVFVRGLRRIFNLTEDDDLLEEFYEQVRCGLFHDGMTKGKVIINRTWGNVIDFSDPDAIKINPKKFIDIIIKDFSNYIIDLRDVSKNDLRRKFDCTFTNINPE